MALLLAIAVSPEVQPVPIPDDIFAVSKMARVQGRLYLVDHLRHTLWLLAEGQPPKPYFRDRGGPGSYGQLVNIRVFGDKLYLPTGGGRKIVVLDKDLNFVKDIVLDGVCRDVLVTQDSLYVVMATGNSEHMVHRFNGAMEPQNAFGSALQDRRLVGHQSGQVLQHGEHILFLHHMLPQVETFALDGSPVAKVSLPGFHDPFVATDSKTGLPKRFEHCFVDFFSHGDRVFLKMVETRTRKAWLWSYLPDERRFDKKIPCPFLTVSDNQGGLFEVVLNDDREAVALRPIPLNMEE